MLKIQSCTETMMGFYRFNASDSAPAEVQEMQEFAAEDNLGAGTDVQPCASGTVVTPM